MTQWTDANARVAITLENGIADVRLTRTDKMNALDPAMFDGINAAIAWLGTAPGLRVVVLSGEGRAFCAGLDMVSMAGTAGGPTSDLPTRTNGITNRAQHVAWGWRDLAVPVIAAVHGVALGGGFQVMSGADIRITHPDTRLSIMEMKWGLVPDMGGMALWRGLVRDDVLRELSYTAREFTGEEALRLGFATQLSDDPRADALALAQSIAGRNPEAIRAMKRLANIWHDADAGQLMQAESDEQTAIIRKPNQIEAVTANFEKRAPVFVDPV